MTDDLIDGAKTELGHNGTELVGDIVEEVDDVLGVPWNFFRRSWVAIPTGQVLR